jgi:WD40 repeat protein
MLIYDIRVTGRLVGWLEGRSAETNQRLGVDVFPCVDNEGVAEIWAGGTDGTVRVWKWKSVGDDQKGMGTAPTDEWKAHESVMTGVAVHPSGTVLATSSGQRQEMGEFNDEDSGSESDSESADDSAASTTSSCSSREARRPPENSIKIWGL